MRIVLCAIDAKYIHTNLALRLLKANCPLPCDLREYTIKDDVARIAAEIVAAKPDLVGFSAYLWNIRMVLDIATSLHGSTTAKIVVGGPEVSFDAEHYMGVAPLDFIIRGEGELAFERLVEALSIGSGLELVPNLVRRSSDGIRLNPVFAIRDLAAIASPYRFPEDDRELPHRIQYLELSRGCPFACTYCLAPLEGPVRFFPLERMKRDILDLMDRGAKTFKFLDRTFNLRPELAKAVFDFLIDVHRPDCVFQFEITGDIFPEELIEHLNRRAPKGLFRFEIGVQTTNELAAQAVKRHQDNERLFRHIRMLLDGGKVIIHLDLIAGLPHESLASFVRTFDETFALGASELQLGFLKLLRGTPLRSQASTLAYAYRENPPYEITESDAMSAEDLLRIHRVEDVLERFWNKGWMKRAMLLTSRSTPSMFVFLETLSAHLAAEGFDFLRYQPSDLYAAFDRHASQLLPEQSRALHDALVMDCLDEAKMKPNLWWQDALRGQARTAALRSIHAHDDSLPLDDLYKYAVVTPRKGGLLLALFLPQGKVLAAYDGDFQKIDIV